MNIKSFLTTAHYKITHYKPLLVGIFALAATAMVVNISQAADAEIICTSSCSSLGSPLFSEEHVHPGETITKSLEIKNQRNQAINLNLEADKKSGTDDDFLQQVQVLVKLEDGTVKFDNDLETFLDSNVDLESLGADSEQTYSIALILPTDTGNDFQAKDANFDIKVNISGEDETTEEENGEEGGNNEGDGGTEGDGGDNDGGDTEGTGDGGESIANTGLGETILDVFQGEVAGETIVYYEELSPTPNQGETQGIAQEENQGDVAGVSTKTCPVWWIVLLVQTILLGGLYYLLKRHQEKKNTWWLVVTGVVILGKLVDWYAHTHWFTPSNWCKYEIFIAAVLAVAETGVLDFIQRDRL